jgi:hypothetical protein
MRSAKEWEGIWKWLWPISSTLASDWMNRDEVKHRKSIPKQDHARMILGESFPEGIRDYLRIWIIISGFCYFCDMAIL